tara:strand:+ start:686 stop:880 length:195 start_codon:yes stop_codon:yes gene_type:complete
MTIINLKTGKARITKKEPLPKCKLCNTDVDNKGLTGKVNEVSVSFCYMCMTDIIQMMVDKQNNA